MPMRPCIRQRPFGIAGAWQEFPLRVFGSVAEGALLNQSNNPMELLT